MMVGLWMIECIDDWLIFFFKVAKLTFDQDLYVNGLVCL